MLLELPCLVEAWQAGLRDEQDGTNAWRAFGRHCAGSYCSAVDCSALAGTLGSMAMPNTEVKLPGSSHHMIRTAVRLAGNADNLRSVAGTKSDL